jgi:hypothetical protein
MSPVLPEKHLALLLLWLRAQYFCPEISSLCFKRVTQSTPGLDFELVDGSPIMGSVECQDHLASMKHVLTPDKKDRLTEIV